MRWMTKREVERAARKGPKAALDNSIEKYTQMLNAPAKDLQAKLERTEGFDCGEYCALCQYNYEEDCGACPLVIVLKCECYSLGWRAYCHAIHAYRFNNGPITPVRKAICTLLRNMKKARKALRRT